MKVRLSLQQTSVNPDTPRKPTVEELNLEWGQITRYNTKIMGDGKQYVINGSTGEAMRREDADPYYDRKKEVFWLPKGEKPSATGQYNIYKWKNPGGIFP